MLENYEIMENGVIKQIKIINKIKEYNKEYADKYNKYGIKGTQLAHLRLGVLIGAIGFIPKSIIDIGYGNGDFLSACSNIIPECYGNDISNYNLPNKCNFIDYNGLFKRHFDVVCFFDSLEHFPEITWIKNLDCDYIIMTVPWCHNYSNEWFKNWYHRREDEHLWHFNDKSLLNFFSEMGFDNILINNFEDTIRKNDNCKNENILAGVFKKKK